MATLLSYQKTRRPNPPVASTVTMSTPTDDYRLTTNYRLSRKNPCSVSAHRAASTPPRTSIW